jgi:hypothetical protein
VRLEQGAELIAGRGAGPHMVLTQPHQSLELLEAHLGWVQPAQPMPVGPQVVGQLVAVAGIGLGPRRAPPRAGGPERGGVHRHDWVTGGEQALHDQPIGALDDDRQRGRFRQACQSLQRPHQVLLGVPQRPTVDHDAGVVQHRHSMAGARPVPAHEHLASLMESVMAPQRVRPLSPVLHCSALDGAGP